MILYVIMLLTVIIGGGTLYFKISKLDKEIDEEKAEKE